MARYKSTMYVCMYEVCCLEESYENMQKKTNFENFESAFYSTYPPDFTLHYSIAPHEERSTLQKIKHRRGGKKNKTKQNKTENKNKRRKQMGFQLPLEHRQGLQFM